MKDLAFNSNTKLFSEVEDVKRNIREDIHNKCRNSSNSSNSKSACSSCNISSKAVVIKYRS